MSKRTLMEFGRKIRKQASEVFKESITGPDEDLDPAVFVCADDSTDFSIAGVATDFFGSASDQITFYYEVVPSLIKEVNATKFGLIATCWAVRLGDEATIEDFRAQLAEYGGDASRHPNAEEIVSLNVADNEGNYEAWSAKIRRRPNRSPVLGRWRKDTMNIRGGAAYDPVLAALKGEPIPERPDAEEQRAAKVADFLRSTRASHMVANKLFMEAGYSHEQIELMWEQGEHKKVHEIAAEVQQKFEAMDEDDKRDLYEEFMGAFMKEIFEALQPLNRGGDDDASDGE